MQATAPAFAAAYRFMLARNRLLPNLSLCPAVLTHLCCPSAAVSVNLHRARLTLSRAILLGGSSSSASGERLICRGREIGSVFFLWWVCSSQDDVAKICQR